MVRAGRPKREALAARRRARGLSQERLAELLDTDRSTVGRWERGETDPWPQHRKRLAEVLAVSPAELDVLLDGPRAAQPSMDTVDPDDFRALTRNPRRTDPRAIEALSVVLAGQRTLEDVVGSQPMIQPVTAQLAVLTPMVAESHGRHRKTLVDVAAQWAQFAGWIHANTGELQRARQWLDRAAEWSSESGNDDLAAVVLSYKGHIAWEERAVGPVVGLSQAAQRIPGIYVGQAAFAAGQEARGHALAGDAKETDRKLIEADRLWERAADDPNEPPPWSYFYSPSFAQLQRGIVHHLLGRHDARRARMAADALADGLHGLPEEMRNAEWVGAYLYYMAISQMHAGEPEQACAAIAEAAHIARVTDSGRVANQVELLRKHVAATWPTLPTVADLAEKLDDLNVKKSVPNA
jgi:transcriptional regulator with XRE-family HTH domain